jgi:hypothetical protein
MKIPFNEKYVLELGKAVYAFAYYEWNIIYIIDSLRDGGFVKEYSRPKKGFYTSGGVQEKLKDLVEKTKSNIEINNSLNLIHSRFVELINLRNALIHGHPSTSFGGEQVLIYQANPKEEKNIRDKIWKFSEIEKFTLDLNKEILRTNKLMKVLNIH